MTRLWYDLKKDNNKKSQSHSMFRKSNPGKHIEVHTPNMTTEDCWEGILSATMFALKVSYLPILQATQNMLSVWKRCHDCLYVTFQAVWHFIKELRQAKIYQKI